MATFLSDVRYAIRRLRRAPAFAAFTSLLLAVAIGTNTAIFSLLDALSLRDLPVLHPEQLVQVAVATPSAPVVDMSVSLFRELGRRQQVFSALIGWDSAFSANVEIDGELSRVNPWCVTGNFYDELGTRPFAGRLLSPGDDSPTGRVVVVGHDYWQRRFHGDLAVLGRTIRIEDVPFVVVGIAPRYFSGVGLSVEPDLTIPLGVRPAIQAATDAPFDPHFDQLGAVGRLKPGVTLQQASAQLHAEWSRVKDAAVPPEFDQAQRAEFAQLPLVVTSAAKGADQWLRSELTHALALLMAAAIMMLAIACINLAGLMLSRVAAGVHEWRVRAALGATMWQMTRPVVMESALLTSLGAAGGAPIAAWGVMAFRQWSLSGVFPATAPVGLTLDLRVLVFVSGLVLAVGLLVSAAAVAWLARFGRHVPASAGTRVTRHIAGPVLVAAQVGLSLMLMGTAMLFGRNVQELRSTRDLHYQREGVTVFTLRSRPNGYKNLENDAYQPLLLAQIQAIPGVRAASLGLAPAPGALRAQPISLPATQSQTAAPVGAAAPGFFATLGIPVLAGRDFTWHDGTRAPRVAIVSQSLARHLVGDGDAIGRRIRIGTDAHDPDAEVVGVVADAKLFDFQHPTALAAYVPQLQQGSAANFKHVLIRTDRPSGAVNAAVQRVVASLGHEYVERTRTLAERTDDDFSNEWLVAELAAWFGIVALVLTAVGLYSMLSYAVEARRKELGVRLALGAEPRRLVVLVAGNGLRIAAAGTAFGAAGVWAAGRLLTSWLTGIGGFDPWTLVASPVVMLVVAVGACIHPAVRAARTDPIVALRAD